MVIAFKIRVTTVLIRTNRIAIYFFLPIALLKQIKIYSQAFQIDYIDSPALDQQTVGWIGKGRPSDDLIYQKTYK